MASKPFQFRQFSVADDRCAHKVGTDAVLLGTWVRVPANDISVLDVGTGCGVIALILAQRTSDATSVHAIEISEADAMQAAENVANSPWSHRVTVFHQALQDFSPHEPYDLVVSNPPYFVNSLLPPGKQRSRARHTLDLSFESLIESGNRLLKDKGRLALILPPAEAGTFNGLATRYGMRCLRRTLFHSKHGRPAERVLMEWAKTGVPEPDTHLVLCGADGNWSAEYRALTRDFYLRAADPAV